MSENEDNVPFGERTFATYEEAWAAAREAEERFAAGLPVRAQGFADRINAVLPDGLRFEWALGGDVAELTKGLFKPPPDRVRVSYLTDSGATRQERLPFTAGSLKVSGTIPVEFNPGALEALLEMFRPRCGALLFPLPPCAPRPVEPVHPLDAPYFAPVQGPQPAVCALDKGHRIGWHWHNGTWWKA